MPKAPHQVSDDATFSPAEDNIQVSRNYPTKEYTHQHAHK